MKLQIRTLLVVLSLLWSFSGKASAGVVSGSTTYPVLANQLPYDVQVSFAGASDNAGGSGLKSVHLWVKRDFGGWKDSGQSVAASAGVITYRLTQDGVYSFALQAEDLAGNRSLTPDGNTQAHLQIDIISPTAANTLAPATAAPGTVKVSFTGAVDAGSGSGVAEVELWVSKDGGTWKPTALVSASGTGSFNYLASTTGLYAFATRSRDRAGNFSPVPTGSGTSSTLVTGSSDACPDDAAKTKPGRCGCGVVEDTGDFDRDGTINCLDPDDDNDGLSDAEEKTLKTDPRAADSDLDRVSDGQEVLDGSNPLDAGSVVEARERTLCAEWNGFLGGMWNILELVNTSDKTPHVTTKLYDINGAHVSSQRCTIAGGGQCDMLVHGMEGRALDSYGKVCSTHDGAPGELDGRMVYYKQNSTLSSAGAFQFAFAMPLTNGKLGKQFLPFNTFQPSLAPEDAAHPVANWIQLTNLGDKATRGKLTFYGQQGNVLGQQSVALAAGQRRDYSGHQFGPGLVGMVAWEPAETDVPCVIRNVRYLYDNTDGLNSFTTAFQLEGLAGSGETLVVPLDTRSSSAIVEILNTLNRKTATNIKVYDENGHLRESYTLKLPAHGSFHFIADTILGANARGIAVVQGDHAESLVVVGMQYGRTNNGGISHMYGVPAVQPLGHVLKGSYNTFLAQDAELLLLNPSAAKRDVSISMERGDSPGSPLPNLDQEIPAHGLRTIRLGDFESEDHYGVVTVQTSSPVVAWMLRRRGLDYVMPTPLRQ